MTADLRIERAEGSDGAVVAAILADLPEWFGLPESNAGYAAAAARLANYTALAGDGEPVGIALVERHFPPSAELHLLAVRRAWHRRGVGRALVAAVAADLRAAGVRMLTVKTLGPSHPDEGYRATREFYEAMGFVPLEELRGVWPDDPCLLMAKSLD